MKIYWHFLFSLLFFANISAQTQSVAPKTLAEIKAEFSIQGEPLHEDHYQNLLLYFQELEMYGDDGVRLADLESFKRRLAFLNSLSEQEWSYIPQDTIYDFTDPSVGYNELEHFKEAVADYAPIKQVPDISDDAFEFYLFDSQTGMKKTRWPLLVVLDKVIYNLPAELERFAEKNHLNLDHVSSWWHRILPDPLKLQLMFVAEDGTKTPLTAYPPDAFGNYVGPMKKVSLGNGQTEDYVAPAYYIPPGKGRVYWRYVNVSLTSRTHLYRHGPWVGGIAITHGYALNDSTVSAIWSSGGREQLLPVPISELGDPDWDIEAHFQNSHLWLDPVMPMPDLNQGEEIFRWPQEQEEKKDSSHFLEQVKADFVLRGASLSDAYYQVLSDMHYSHQQSGDASVLNHINAYKAQLAYLNSLTDAQWDQIPAHERVNFSDPGVGYNGLDDFKDQVGIYVSEAQVPVEGFARFYVFANPMGNATWPILAVVDGNLGAWDEGSIEFKFVAGDGTESLLRETDFGTNAFFHIERGLYYIPPVSGHLYYRYQNGDWAGGIAITHGHPEADAGLISDGDNPAASIPMQNLGDANWDVDAHFLQKERQQQQENTRAQRLSSEINPLRDKMSAQLYPEDFHLLMGKKTYELHPQHAPQWALDAQQTLKTFFGDAYGTVMVGIRNAVFKKHGSPNIVQTSQWPAPTPESPQWHHDAYNEWRAAEDLRIAQVEKRRAEIAAERAGTTVNQQVQGGQTVGDTQNQLSTYDKSKAFINKLKKALKSEKLFSAKEFGSLEQAIKKGNMPLVFAKLKDYQSRGGAKVKKAVKRLRKMLKSIQALESLSS